MEDTVDIVNNMPNWYRQKSRGDSGRSNYESFYPVYERIRENIDYQRELIEELYYQSIKKGASGIVSALLQYAEKNKIDLNKSERGYIAFENYLDRLQKSFEQTLKWLSKEELRENELKTIIIDISSKASNLFYIFSKLDIEGYKEYKNVEEVFKKKYIMETVTLEEKIQNFIGTIVELKESISKQYGHINRKFIFEESYHTIEELTWDYNLLYCLEKYLERNPITDRKSIKNLLSTLINSPENIEELYSQIQNRKDIDIEMKERYIISSIQDKNKDEIIEMLKKESPLFVSIAIDYLKDKYEWTDEEKKDIFSKVVKIGETMDLYPFKDECTDYYIEWMQEFLKEQYPIMYKESYLNLMKKNNPIYASELRKDLQYEIVPWITDDISTIEIEDIKKQHILLMEIFERLDIIGAIEHGCLLDGLNNCDKSNIEEKIKNLNPESDRIQITTYLLFYLNKLTKLDRATMYYKALEYSGFEYDIEMEMKLLQKSEDELSDKELFYKYKKKNAEEKGNLEVNTLRYLYGNDPELYSDGKIPFNRPSNYQKKVMESRRLKESNFSKNSTTIGSFTEFLEEWVQNYRNTGNIRLPYEEGKMGDFYNKFNKLIVNVVNAFKEGERFEEISEEITENFLFCSKTLDNMNKLYEVKVLLIQQLMEYAKDPAYKDQIAVQIGKNSNPTDHTTNDLVYIYVDGLSVPISFHTNLAVYSGVEELPTVSDKVKRFFNRNSVNVIYSMSEDERNEYIASYEQTESEKQIDEIINKIKSGEYKSITNIKNITSFQKYRKNIDRINKFVSDVINIQGNLELDELENFSAIIMQDDMLIPNEKILEILNKQLMQSDKLSENESTLIKIATILINRSRFQATDEVKYFKDSEKGIELGKLVESLSESEKISEDEELRIAFAKGLDAIKEYIGYEEVEKTEIATTNLTDIERRTIEDIVEAVGIERAIEVLREDYKNYAQEYYSKKQKRINAQDLGKATYDADTQMCAEAQHVVKELIEQRKDNKETR